MAAVALYTYCQKFKTECSSLWRIEELRLSTVSRKDLMALTEEAARVSGIDYVMNAYATRQRHPRRLDNDK